MLNLEWIGTKRMGEGRLAAGALAVALMVVGASVAARAEPLLIAYAVWVGYGPLFIAKDKGFFDQEGLDVQMIRIAQGSYEDLSDGQVDVVANTVDAVASWAWRFDAEDRPVCFLALDNSVGGDGIVATNDIQGFADLEGKTVAFNEFSVSQFYLNVLLREAGLRAGDIEPVPMAAVDAAEAFMLGDVDAAVIWEPWLSQAAKTPHWKLLADSSERPGLIVDCLITKASTLEERKGDMRAVARAWAKAVDYYDAHPEEAIAIMARYVGSWLEDPAVFAQTLEGVRFYDRERNKAYFGTAENNQGRSTTPRKKPSTSGRASAGGGRDLAGRHHRSWCLGRIGVVGQEGYMGLRGLVRSVRQWSRRLGLRGRLLLAFMSVSAFVLIATIAAMYAFSVVERTLARITEERVPTVLDALTLSRQAESVIVGAPKLLAAADDQSRQSVWDDVSERLIRLRDLLDGLEGEADPVLWAELRRDLGQLAINLAELNRVVARRLELAEERDAVARRVLNAGRLIRRTSEPAKRLLELKLARWRALQTVCGAARIGIGEPGRRLR